MRQFTDSEQVAMEKAWNKNFNDEPALSFYDSLEAGFIAGLDTAAEQIAALTAERNSLRELERLAKDVADYIRDTSWSMGPIRKLVEYIDNKNKENKDNE